MYIYIASLQGSWLYQENWIGSEKHFVPVDFSFPIYTNIHIRIQNKITG